MDYVNIQTIRLPKGADAEAFERHMRETVFAGHRFPLTRISTGERHALLRGRRSGQHLWVAVASFLQPSVASDRFPEDERITPDTAAVDARYGRFKHVGVYRGLSGEPDRVLGGEDPLIQKASG